MYVLMVFFFYPHHFWNSTLCQTTTCTLQSFVSMISGKVQSMRQYSRLVLSYPFTSGIRSTIFSKTRSVFESCAQRHTISISLIQEGIGPQKSS
jgi:hypothetical protein